jgi:RNA polymerase sigma-70 factor, ECF subfamily
MTTTVRARQAEFERVAMPHSPSLLRVASQLARNAPAAEDLVQDTLLRAWRSVDQFQTGTNAKAWLFRILFNRCRAVRRNVRSRAATVSLDQAGAESNGPGQPGLALNELAAVTQALAALSPEHRTVLLLGVVEGFTCRELAEILAIPIGTVMSRLSRARQALRERLAPTDPASRRERSAAVCSEREVRELQ